MARAFESVIRLQLEKYGPEAAKAFHIATARRGLAAYLGKQAEKPAYTIETDGSPATSEASVRPFGVITYRFRRMREIAEFCLAEAIRISPSKSGRYKKSWFVMVDGKAVDAPAVPADAKQVHVTNDQPYSRKINVGARGFEKYAPPGIVEKVRQAALKKYRAIATIEVDYLSLSGGYTLLTNPKAAPGRRGRVLKGKALTYPAVSIRPKF